MPFVKTINELTNATLLIEQPEEQKIEKNGGDKSGDKRKKETIRYFISKYTHANDDDKEALPFYLDLPLATCDGGVLERPEENGRVSFSIKLKFDCHNTAEQTAETKRFVSSMDILHEKNLDHIYNNRAKLGIPTSYDKAQLIPILKSPLYWHLDPSTATRTGHPSQYLKLGVYDNGKTPFFDLNNKIIPWELLSNVTFKAKVSVRFRHLYSSKTHSVQMVVKQVVVSSEILPIQAMNSNSGYTEKIRKEQADLVQKQQESIKLMIARMQKQPANPTSGGASECDNDGDPME